MSPGFENQTQIIDMVLSVQKCHLNHRLVLVIEFSMYRILIGVFFFFLTSVSLKTPELSYAFWGRSHFYLQMRYHGVIVCSKHPYWALVLCFCVLCVIALYTWILLDWSCKQLCLWSVLCFFWSRFVTRRWLTIDITWRINPMIFPSFP